MGEKSSRPQFSTFNYILICFYVVVVENECQGALWGLEDNFQELVLSLHHVDYTDQIVKLGSKHPVSHLTSSILSFNMKCFTSFCDTFNRAQTNLSCIPILVYMLPK